MTTRGSHHSQIVNRLRLAGGGIVTCDELVSAMYPDPDEEPDSAESILRMAVCDLRAAGFPIRNWYGRGYWFQPSAQG